MASVSLFLIARPFLYHYNKELETRNQEQGGSYTPPTLTTKSDIHSAPNLSKGA